MQIIFRDNAKFLTLFTLYSHCKQSHFIHAPRVHHQEIYNSKPGQYQRPNVQKQTTHLYSQRATRNIQQFYENALSQLAQIIIQCISKDNNIIPKGGKVTQTCRKFHVSKANYILNIDMNVQSKVLSRWLKHGNPVLCKRRSIL